jgi:hypothetical protein
VPPIKVISQFALLHQSLFLWAVKMLMQATADYVSMRNAVFSTAFELLPFFHAGKKIGEQIFFLKKSIIDSGCNFHLESFWGIWR